MAAVEPVATLGGELPTDSLTREEKKKQKKKQQKVAFYNVAFSLAFVSLQLTATSVFDNCRNP